VRQYPGEKEIPPPPSHPLPYDFTTNFLFNRRRDPREWGWVVVGAVSLVRQYPGEKEITFPPYTCLESDGDPRVERSPQGEVVIFPLKVPPLLPPAAAHTQNLPTSPPPPDTGASRLAAEALQTRSIRAALARLMARGVAWGRPMLAAGVGCSARCSPHRGMHHARVRLRGGG
jgi:hypothetical protein